MIKANFLISVIIGLSAVNVASAQVGETPDELIGHLQGSEKKWVPDTRVSGVGSQILRELGLKKIRLLAAPLKYPSLSGFDLEVVGFVK